MEEFLNSIGIKGNFTQADDGCLTLDIKDANEYGKIFSILDKCEYVDEDEDASQTTYESSSIQYVNDDYTITLLADMEADNYKLSIREN